MDSVLEQSAPVRAPRGAHRRGFSVRRLVVGMALVVGLGSLIAITVGHTAVQRTQSVMTPAAQLLALPGGTVTAMPDYATIAFAGAQQAGYGVTYEGEDHTLGTYVIAQAASPGQARALADRYFARATRPIRDAGGTLYASPRGNSDAWSYTDTGMVGGACIYGAGFVRGAAFYQFMILSGGMACQQAEQHLTDWMDRMPSAS